MKRNAKKLTLSKETLRSLETEQTAGIAGGAPQITGRRDCYTKYYSYCETCGIACTVECTF